MKTLKILLLGLIAFFLLLIPCLSSGSQKPEEAKTIVVTKTVSTVQDMIDEIAPKFGQEPKLISKISYCESMHRVVVHDGGYGKGVTGIHRKTFEGWLPLYQKEMHETLNYDSTYDQVKMMAWAFSKGDSYRNQWSTYVAYKKGGVYSFYSKLLKGHYTVYCK